MNSGSQHTSYRFITATKETFHSADNFRMSNALKTIGIAIFLVCLLLGISAAQNADDSGSRSSILALEHAWDQALERQDIKALSAIFDNSLVYVDYDGRLLTKAEYLARVKANAAHIQQIVAEGMTVQLFGNTAIVVGTYRFKGMDGGKPSLVRGRFTDTWVFESKNWMCVAAASTPLLQ